jgi:hypothetical protein
MPRPLSEYLRLYDATGGYIADEVAKLEAKVAAAYEALRCLPLDSFTDDMDKADAADFVDNANGFFEAMQKARAIFST